ncbi:hypothetical protein SAMN04488033_11635 [Salegentibacter agarivorans]|uniref:Uncharacterized protein n=1 Tax=Salegentibacter agarivorans TaxID=345907 RepID=A0A1I2MUP7_9FLAO|nr:hypothetical protein [Salegentibacter agarivorans]SFF95315.1 hypothetical protein SAMN04488033_11635 [Salegentibacter agarivorans]
MKIKNLFIYVILLSFINGYSQQDDSYELKILFSGMIENHKIDYQKSEKNSRIIVSRLVSNSPSSENDYLKMKELIAENKEYALRKVIQITEKYKEYERDTLYIESENSLEKTVTDFVQNWKRIKNNMKLNPDKRLILDGYGVVIFLKTNELNYDHISARSPSSTSHPEIFDLISKVKAFYKNEAKNPILE